MNQVICEVFYIKKIRNTEMFKTQEKTFFYIKRKTTALDLYRSDAFSR